VFAGCGVILFAMFLPPPTDDAMAVQVPSADSPELPWEPYSPDNLQRYRDQGKTVMVDFTADW
jgi:thiol:disulfide interchange protein